MKIMKTIIDCLSARPYRSMPGYVAHIYSIERFVYKQSSRDSDAGGK